MLLGNSLVIPQLRCETICVGGAKKKNDEINKLILISHLFLLTHNNITNNNCINNQNAYLVQQHFLFGDIVKWNLYLFYSSYTFQKREEQKPGDIASCSKTTNQPTNQQTNKTNNQQKPLHKDVNGRPQRLSLSQARVSRGWAVQRVMKNKT